LPGGGDQGEWGGAERTSEKTGGSFPPTFQEPDLESVKKCGKTEPSLKKRKKKKKKKKSSEKGNRERACTTKGFPGKNGTGKAGGRTGRLQKSGGVGVEGKRYDELHRRRKLGKHGDSRPRGEVLSPPGRRVQGQEKKTGKGERPFPAKRQGDGAKKRKFFISEKKKT